MDNILRQLKNDLKTKVFKPVYLLYGEERYLVNHYSHSFAETLFDADASLMNKDTFEGPVPVEPIIDAANTLPFFSEYRLVLVRDSRLFMTGRKDDTEGLAAYLPEIPKSTIIVFIETEADKRNRLYKKVSETGLCVAFETPKTEELITWVINIFKKKSKVISPQTARILLRTVSHNMTALYAEADKLGDYTGDRKEILPEDIDAVCSPSLEARVFDLLGDMGNGRTENALRLYRNMVLMKEQPLAILAMIIRQFRIMLQCKYASEKKMTLAQTAALLDVRTFIIEECLIQSRRYTLPSLMQALHECQDIDLRIKTGLLNAEYGVETLIVRYGRQRTELKPIS